jgi:hypothetical protein
MTAVINTSAVLASKKLRKVMTPRRFDATLAGSP